jgi:hypothetical protein
MHINFKINLHGVDCRVRDAGRRQPGRAEPSHRHLPVTE